jgi:hypothetical protein
LTDFSNALNAFFNSAIAGLSSAGNAASANRLVEVLDGLVEVLLG